MDAMLVSDEMAICLLLCFLSLQHVSLHGPQDPQAHDKRIRDQRDSVNRDLKFLEYHFTLISQRKER